MSAIKLFTLILCLVVGQFNPFVPLTLLGNESNNVVEGDNTEIVDTPTDTVVSENSYNIKGFLTTELDGYCTIDIPQSHWQTASSTELNTTTTRYFKYKDNKTRLLMGYVTDIPKGTDIPGYIVQGAAKVDMVTNTKQEVTYGDSTWMMIPSADLIDDMQVIVWYKLGKDSTSAFWMRATVDPNIDTEEFNNVIESMVKTYNMYYISGSIFETPTTGIYKDGQGGETANPNDWRDNNDGNTVFQGRGGFDYEADISDDWLDMEIIIDGHKYKLPCTVNEFTNSGFSIYEGNVKLTDSVPINDRVTFSMLNNLGTVIDVTVLNESKESVKPINECSVIELTVDSADFIDIATLEEIEEANEEISTEEESTDETSEEIIEEPEAPEDESETVEETSETIEETIEETVEETSETVSGNSIKTRGKQYIILACGATEEVYTDDLIDKYGSCTKADYDDNSITLTFKSGKKCMFIRMGSLKGIEAVTLSVDF